ncbi:MAG: 16S rRNA (uracil(1498)-N(3))-methyltransferase [Thiothrix sp.]
MRIPRFYLIEPLQVGQSLTLPAETFRHAIQVLRLAVGEPLILFNGKGGEYRARLSAVSKRSASVQIEEFNPGASESPLAMTLVQAIIKPDKMDFALQKAVELGVMAIQPLITQHSVVRVAAEKTDKKMQHWQGVIIAACEQAGRTRLPHLHAPLTLTDYLAQANSGTRLILAPGAFPRLQQLPALVAPLAVLVGPEGGFTAPEVTQCLQAGVKAVSLGERILRAETASIAMLAILQQRYGDL